MHHGRFAGLTDSEIANRFRGEWRRRAKDKYRWRFPGGESYAAAALELIDRHPVSRPLVVSHEMIGRMLLRHLLNLGPHVTLGRRLPHDVIHEVDPRTGSLRELLSS